MGQLSHISHYHIKENAFNEKLGHTYNHNPENWNQLQNAT